MAESKLTMQSLYPRSPAGRFVWRAPLVFYRLGLGPLVGRLMMVITTTGRKSGLPRSTMVEYHRLNGTKYVVSGFGEEAQWFKNIQVDPNITIQTSDGVESMKAVRVTDDQELLDVIGEFRRTDSAAIIDWYLGSYGVDPADEDILSKKDRIHFLRLETTDTPTPPPMEADLVWFWPVAAVILLLMVLIGARPGKSKS